MSIDYLSCCGIKKLLIIIIHFIALIDKITDDESIDLNHLGHVSLYGFNKMALTLYGDLFVVVLEKDNFESTKLFPKWVWLDQFDPWRPLVNAERFMQINLSRYPLIFCFRFLSLIYHPYYIPWQTIFMAKYSFRYHSLPHNIQISGDPFGNKIILNKPYL